MSGLLLLLIAWAGQAPENRFQSVAPLASLPAVSIDAFSTGYGLAQRAARRENLQARIVWIDGTANLDRMSSDASVAQWMDILSQAGFNAVVYDVKPISGQTLYPSEYAPKIESWKGQNMPLAFDPLKAVVREAHRRGLKLIVSLNSFSEGHQLFRVGPGYAHSEWQTTLLETSPVIGPEGGPQYPLSAKEGVASGDALRWVQSAPVVLAENEQAIGLDARGAVASIAKGGDALKPPTGGVVLVEREPATRLKSARIGDRWRVGTLPHFSLIGEAPRRQYPLMTDPTNPFVQNRLILMVREIAYKYPIDGLIFDDRYRYAGLDADFGPGARQRFEWFVHKSLKWPDDVFKPTFNFSKPSGFVPGPYYDAWMAWRARVLDKFLARAKLALHAYRPDAQLGLYAGSWYGEYAALGTNYASPKALPAFWFASPSYRKSGLASHLDFLIPGCYYRTATIADALAAGGDIGATVESAATLCNRLVRDDAWTFAGLELNVFGDDIEGLERALQAACAASQGVMVFDLSHDIERYLPVFKRAFATPVENPIGAAAALKALRSARASRDRVHEIDDPILITSGTSGVGQ